MEPTKIYIKNNAGAAILAASLILAVIIGGIFYVNKSNSTKNLTVTGSAKMEAKADNVIWRSSVTQNVASSDLKGGYAAIARDVKLATDFIKSKGIADSAINVSAVIVTDDWSQPQGAPKRYVLRQNIEVNSGDVEGVTEIAKNIDQVVNEGAFFQTDGIEYFYSKLNEARVSLLTEATNDARARADAMAKSSGGRAGRLTSASSGVVQVLSKGAVEGGDYGQYDTSKIDKEISVTVRATFSVR